jgi:hypothetical protein
MYDIILQFMGQVNLNDCYGRNISRWPKIANIVPEAEKKTAA